MSLIRKLFVVASLLALTAGPAVLSPSLSLHRPTLSAPAAPGQAPGHQLEFPLGLVGLAGAIKIKDTATIARKFRERASAAAKDYSDGVAAAGADWEQGARAGKDNYVAGVQDAISRDAFLKGIANAGSQKYVDNAVKLGTQRYPQGIAQSEPSYVKGVQPHLDMMKGLNLPPKGPKGSQQNQARADAVAKANRMLKVGR